MYEKSLTPGNLVGSAAGPKVTRDFHLTASMAFTSSGSFGDTATSASSSSSAASAGTLPTKLKAKDLEKRVLEYAKQNPQSDLKLVGMYSLFNKVLLESKQFGSKIGIYSGCAYKRPA